MKNKYTKINKYLAESLPASELDFHGMGILNDVEIKKITEKFIEDCKNKNIKKALIITGKGLHSKNGVPVIKPMVSKILSSNNNIKTFYDSRIDRGSEGAIEIVLF